MGATPSPPLKPADLRAALELEDLDGRAAQRVLAPVSRGPRPDGADGVPPRDAGALAYVFPAGGRLHLPLTVRQAGLPEHGGQVSLPGGRPLDGEDLWDTARREAEEEIGLDAGGAERLGRLAPVYIPVTHSRLHVHVALGKDPGALVPDPREVARIVVVRLDDLADPRRVAHRARLIAGREIQVPYFDVEGLFLWGATAMALAELVARLGAVTQRPRG